MLPNLRPTLLSVMAHPDDETFGMGGTLAWYARAGAITQLICATGGEMGDVAPEYLDGYASIADRRRAELECATTTLGIAKVIMLGYRDSGMEGAPANQHPEALAAAPIEEVAARVTQHIRALRPQVVVTFDPIGGYRHPDHIAIHRATVRAFHAAGDPHAYPSDLPPHTPQKLYYQTFPRGLLRFVVRMMPLFGRDPRHFGRNGDIDIASIAETDFPIHTTIDYLSVAEIRAIASACHASQGGNSPMMRGLPPKLLALFGGRETFMRAYPPAAPGLREDDLFAGVVYK